MYDKKIKPIIKWTGGKSQELPIIKEYMPNYFNNYYEPFIGGGAVWFSIDANKHKLYINDYSSELIDLYKTIKYNLNSFTLYVEEFMFTWKYIERYVYRNKDTLIDLYLNFKEQRINEKDVLYIIRKIINNKSFTNLYNETDVFKKEYEKQILLKLNRMILNTKKRGELNKEDIIKNIETGFKTALYTGCRYLYNINRFSNKNKIYEVTLYFIMRNYSYSGMFRYNKNGYFNVPYGGISYNKKNLLFKLQEYRQEKLIKHLKKTKIIQGDFEDFLKNKVNLKKNDFIFLDPPYDSEFSTYDGNKFEEKEQKRLANYLINDCIAKWMIVIKYTDFIYELYNNKKNINITFFDKKYNVSFMDRNNRDVQHIIIKNY